MENLPPKSPHASPAESFRHAGRIGGSVGFEVDVGAIADKAADLGKKVWNALKFW